MSQEKESEFNEKMNEEIERGVEELREFVEQNQAEQKVMNQEKEKVEVEQVQVEVEALDAQFVPVEPSVDKMVPLDVLPDASETNETHLLLLQEVQELRSYVELQLSRQRELFQGIEAIVRTHGDQVSESTKSIKRLRMVVNKVEEEQGTLQSIYEEFDRKYQEDQQATRKLLDQLSDQVRDPGANKRKKNVQELEFLEREINKFK